jgi:proteasome lid subunit RPN8/RPN11
MIVELHRNELDNFRRRARLSKVEILAVLLGHKLSQNLLRITNFVYPKCKASAAKLDADLSAIYTWAQLGGVQVLGTIHSHPEAFPILSPRDHENHRQAPADAVSGVVSVFGAVTTAVFWRADSSLPCQLRYFV